MPVIISTSSIALQNAIAKDYIPEISRILMEHGIIKTPLSCVVRKGREHYLCEHRLCTYYFDADSDTKSVLDTLLRRAASIDLADVDGLTPYMKRRIGVAGRCGEDCPRLDCCRYLSHIKDAQSNRYDFQITNHNYLLADILRRKAGQPPLIPHYQAVIIDEGHKFLGAARQMYGVELDSGAVPEITGLIRSTLFRGDCGSKIWRKARKLYGQHKSLFSLFSISNTDEDSEHAAVIEESRGIYQMVISWKIPDGKRSRKSISTGLTVKGNKKRAEEMLIRVRKEQEERLASMPVSSEGEILFADHMEKWLQEIKSEVKLTTYGGYQLNVQKAIAPYFRKRGILLRELTADDINDFYAEKLEHLKATTVHKFHTNISKALKYAVEKNLIEHSVMDRVKRPKAKRFVGKFLKQSETIGLFEAVKGHKFELGVILGAFYGLRRGEIIGLRWESIDFEANTITIEHTVTTATVDGKSILVVDDTTKSLASYRTLPLVPAFREKLLAVKSEQEQNRKLCGRSYNKVESCYIYTDPLGNRIHPNYLSDEFPAFLNRHDFRQIRFHDLRHSCASLLLANGVPLKQIQEWLGHSDFAITANTYAHLEYQSKLAAANAMQWINETDLGKRSDGKEKHD